MLLSLVLVRYFALLVDDATAFTSRALKRAKALEAIMEEERLEEEFLRGQKQILDAEEALLYLVMHRIR